ncbi:hypothetical protein [Paraburkholderia sp.]|uniref:hypothetical protein n=1 Tax=Paraburkholderia sp. TaxID=1926495 RepID=UPI0039E344FF
MMTLTQFYLTKISEEADEIAQIALKAQQFGLSEVQPGRDQSNAQRMYGEINDLLAMVHRLSEVSKGEFFFDIGLPDHVAISMKLSKVEKYLAYSRSLGLVEPEQHSDERCDRAPEGWHCSREKDHAGPCAAHPDDSDDNDVIARSKRVLALVDTYLGPFSDLPTKQSRDDLRHGLMREFGVKP